MLVLSMDYLEGMPWWWVVVEGPSDTLFGVIMVMSVVIGSVTPPVGILTYISCSIGGISISQAIRGLVPFCAVLIVVLLLCAIFPAIIMTVPSLFGS